MKLVVLALAFAIPGSFAADTAADLQKKFVGSWRLVSIEGLNQIVKGKPSGIIMYDNTGHMSVQVTLGDKPVFPALGAKATEHEKAAAFDNYIAYYGTYTFEPENGIVIHHLEGSHVPSQIGQDNIRYFEFSGNRLTLSVANDGKGGRLARADSSAHVTWEKIPVNR
jgi:hypothetical protein